MKPSLRRKVALFYLSLLLIMTIFASIITTFDLQSYYKTRLVSELEKHISAVSYLLSQNQSYSDSGNLRYQYISGYARSAELRITLIDSTGIVLFDSKVPQDSLKYLENHLYRPEVQSAIENGFGIDDRVSVTINQPLFYAAQKIHPNSPITDHMDIHFIRLAIPLAEIQNVLSNVQLKIFAGGGVAFIVIAIITYLLAKKITFPILELSKAAKAAKSGNLEAKFKKSTHDEIGELADALNEMLKKLRDDFIQMRKLEKVRSQFLGNVSHELRTPIFAIQGYLETMMNTSNFDQKTFSKFVRKAYNHAVRLNTLLKDLIDISRIESGEMKLNFYHFDIHEWLNKQVEELKPAANENDIKLEFVNKNDENNVYVKGDQERLNQVVVNLVENATKYNFNGGGVKVGYRARGSFVEVYVSDTGRGISEEHISRIFERFYRVDKERSRNVGGTGLGLAIVKHIVEAHESFVHVTSEPGKGSEFSFKLKKYDPT